MTTPSRNLTKFIAVLVGILMSATMLFAQTPSHPRNREKRNRANWGQFIPNFFSQQFRKFRLNFHKKHFDNRNNRHRRFSYKNNNRHNTRGGHQDGYNNRHHRFGRW